jgi:hypothetical protein
MAGIAAARAGITAADRISLQAAYRYLLRQGDALDIASLTPPTPEELASALPDASCRPMRAGC